MSAQNSPPAIQLSNGINGGLIHRNQDMIATMFSASYANALYSFIFTSTDGGLTWPNSSSIANAPVTSLASTSNGYFYRAAGGQVYRSADLGVNWSIIQSGLPSTTVRHLAVNSLDVLFAGLDTRGVWRSTNFGNSWEPFNFGLTDSLILSLYCSQEGYLFTGTYSNGIFKTIERTTSVETRQNTPYNFSLYQNSPNPFNPVTTISFDIARGGLVTLKVFDLLGREVATLVNEEMTPGSYERVFIAEVLASGVYIYQLRAGSFAQTKKLVLMK